MKWSPGSVRAALSGLALLAAALGLFDVPVVSSQGMVIRSHYVEGVVPKQPSDAAWHQIPAMTLPLSGQVITAPVWPMPSTRALRVRSLHDGKHIAFLLEWEDNTINDRLTAGSFRDGLAVGFPLGEAPPFFCMGQLDHYINIWHWKADWQRDIDRCERLKREPRGEGKQGPRIFEPCIRRASAVEDLMGGGFSTLTTKKGKSGIKADGDWSRGVWHVVVWRELGSRDPASEARLEPGLLQTITFAVWNGEREERNGQKAVSPWFQLTIDPVGVV